jgi:hypothetical protein
MRSDRGFFRTAALSLALLASFGVTPASAQRGGPDADAEPPAPVRRMADGTPDISGLYQANAGGANYGLESKPGQFLVPGSRGVVVDPPDGLLPYRDWARAEQIDRTLPQRGYDDPTAHCFVAAGPPRVHYVPSPFQIIQTSGYVVMLFERMSWRIIPLDGREHIPDAIRLWNGDSVGRWEGDTLVVDTRNMNGKTWLNEYGDVTSHAQSIVERYTPTSADSIHYQATVSDPIVFTSPWTIEMDFNRNDDEILEVACHEDNQDLEHLRDVRDEWRAQQAEEGATQQ